MDILSYTRSWRILCMCVFSLDTLFPLNKFKFPLITKREVHIVVSCHVRVMCSLTDVETRWYWTQKPLTFVLQTYGLHGNSIFSYILPFLLYSDFVISMTRQYHYFKSCPLSLKGWLLNTGLKFPKCDTAVPSAITYLYYFTKISFSLQ